MASTDELHVTLHGRGGHAALPGTFANPIGMAAEALMRMEKELPSLDENGQPSVCTFGRIEALGQTNVVPETAHLRGTMRTFDETWRQEMQRRIVSLFESVATARNGSAEVRIAHGYPVLVNHPSLSFRCASYAVRCLGAERVLNLDYRTTADDFAYFSHRVPAFFYRLGVGIPGSPCRLHTSTFQVNDKVFAFAPALMAGMALEVLAGLKD